MRKEGTFLFSEFLIWRSYSVSKLIKGLIIHFQFPVCYESQVNSVSTIPLVPWSSLLSFFSAIYLFIISIRKSREFYRSKSFSGMTFIYLVATFKYIFSIYAFTLFPPSIIFLPRFAYVATLAQIRSILRKKKMLVSIMLASEFSPRI
jgi:hypothetical protein